MRTFITQSLRCVVISSALAVGVAGAAQTIEKAAPAPAPAPAPVQAPAAPPAATAPVAPAASVATPPPVTSPNAAPVAPSTPANPSPAPAVTTPEPPQPATQPGLVAEPPVATDAVGGATSAGTQAEPGALPTADSLLRDVTLTDILLALFALAVTLFAFRSSASAAKLREASSRQADELSRGVAASVTAADAAKRSADVAEQTLAVLRETSERQLRAYVTIRQFLQSPVKDERQNVHGWLLQVAWQNSGATPTKGFRYWAMLREFDRAVPDTFEFAPEGLKDFAGGELGPNGSVNSPPLFVSQQQIARIQDGTRKFLLLGQADYHDMIRDVKHQTQFCVELLVVNDPGGANSSPFSFSYHPRYNSVS